MAFFPCEVSQDWLFHLVEPFVSLSGGRYVRDLAFATGVALLSWLVTLLSVLIVALLVTLLGRSMFWYNHFYTSICLYGTAATGKIILIHTLAKNLYYGVSEVLNNSSAGRAPERDGVVLDRGLGGSVPCVSIPLESDIFLLNVALPWLAFKAPRRFFM